MWRGVMAALAALGALAAATSASSSGAPAIYMFKVSVQAVSSYDGKLHDPWYPPISRSTYGCTPVVAARDADVRAADAAATGRRPADFLFMRGQIPGVFTGREADAGLARRRDPGRDQYPGFLIRARDSPHPRDCRRKRPPGSSTAGTATHAGGRTTSSAARQFFCRWAGVGSPTLRRFAYSSATRRASRGRPAQRAPPAAFAQADSA